MTPSEPHRTAFDVANDLRTAGQRGFRPELMNEAATMIEQLATLTASMIVTRRELAAGLLEALHFDDENDPLAKQLRDMANS